MDRHVSRGVAHPDEAVFFGGFKRVPANGGVCENVGMAPSALDKTICVSVHY